jgi:hypothetical protein
MRNTRRTADKGWAISPFCHLTSLTHSYTPPPSRMDPQLWTANGTADQQWLIQPSGTGYSITSLQSGLAFDGGVNQVATYPQMYPVNGTVDQQWVLQ